MSLALEREIIEKFRSLESGKPSAARLQGPRAIQRRVAQDDKLRAASDYCRETVRIALAADWSSSTQSTMARKNEERTRELTRKELVYAEEELLRSRQARMKQLYEEEAAQYESELKLLGLASLK
eukprot:tig00000342_g24191.t1